MNAADRDMGSASQPFVKTSDESGPNDIDNRTQTHPPLPRSHTQPAPVHEEEGDERERAYHIATEEAHSHLGKILGGNQNREEAFKLFTGLLGSALLGHQKSQSQSQSDAQAESSKVEHSTHPQAHEQPEYTTTHVQSPSKAAKRAPTPEAYAAPPPTPPKETSLDTQPHPDTAKDSEDHDNVFKLMMAMGAHMLHSKGKGKDDGNEEVNGGHQADVRFTANSSHPNHLAYVDPPGSQSAHGSSYLYPQAEEQVPSAAVGDVFVHSPQPSVFIILL